MDVVLSGDPANVDMCGVLAREDPDSIEVLVHKLQAFRVKQLIFSQLLRGTRSPGPTLEK